MGGAPPNNGANPNPGNANPPADPGAIAPVPPNQRPAAPPAAAPNAPAGEITVTLSNPRRSNEIGLHNGLSVNYQFANGAPRFGGIHFRLVIKSNGGDISHAELHGILDQEGTVSVREFAGFGGGLRGPMEIYMEKSAIPGRFGQWVRCSNSVTMN
jgi:hypothetical protein